MTNGVNERFENGRCVRILHVEDNMRDRELIADALLAEGLNCEIVFVSTEDEFRQALDKSGFDLILSDFTLPSFDGATALAISKDQQPEIPFLFVSGTIGLERAVESLKNGATDYVVKDRLQQLGPAVRRALREAQQRREHLRAELERQRVLDQLRASEERFRELAETIQEVFWITDPAKNQMLYISPAYERIWGRTCQSLYDDPASWAHAIHPEDRHRVLHASATQQVEGTYDEEYRIIRPDMQIRWIRDKAFPVRNAAGEVERVVGVARDNTERRQMADQLRQSQKMEAIGQLVGGVAHDFNNILGAIMLQSELIITVENTPPEVRDGLHQIHSAAERAANLIRQLLMFSRKQVIQARELDLNEAVTSLAKMLQRIIGEDIQLQLHLHPLPLITRADASMLDQILMNLAVNARDAMPGGGHLVVETDEKNVDENLARLHPDAVPGRYVCLSVSDTGTGISPENMARIFEPFFTTKEPGKGTGIGLATVFGIAKQHGGFIKVESEVGNGTKFEIFLPASKASPEALALLAQSKPRGGSETILLVEDDQAVCSLVRATLERRGYRVLEAANGVEALKLWEKHSGTVALLLSDLVLPAGMSGQELAGRLQQDKPHLKVIFTSGYSAEIAGRQLKLRNGENFVPKPFPPDQLLETVRRCLDTNG